VTPRCDVHAGQCYRAKAKRGYRHIRVGQVRDLKTETPYALVLEVSPAGREMSRDRTGMRNVQFSVYLVRRDRVWTMPHYYELTERADEAA